MNEFHPLSLERIPGKPVHTGGITVTPVSRRLTLGLPVPVSARKGFVFIWQQPAAIRIEKGGRVEEVPILDVQGIIIAAMLMVGIGLVAFARCTVGKKERNQ